MKTENKNWLYYLFLAIIGYIIYYFQIEKSFNLFSVYSLTIGFSFLSFVSKTDTRKILPLLFVFCLFIMYGIGYEDYVYRLQLESFFILLSLFAFILFVLLGKFSLLIKKTILIITGTIVGSIYIISGETIVEYKYIPFVIGSFFMFRSISFLHEIRFLKKDVPLLDNLNYFLLAPNFSMPLFPIVDYKSFISSYEGLNSVTLKRGSLLICRGLFQMILYRFIYHEIIIPFDEINSTAEVLIYLVANFLIILRVIGAFHIAIGLIVITGYNIPEIFNNIFFATGFSNLWRRTNMYWRNFMIKIFYYPIYFKIKKIGIYPALFISTFACFFITWFLHTYQWFWIKGSFPIELKDAIFWGSFGLLVSVNTLLQQKQLDKGANSNTNAYDFIRQSLNGLIVLLVMSVLWSIWTSNSLENWWTLIKHLTAFDSGQIKTIALPVIGYLLISSWYHYYEKHKANGLSFLKRNMDVFAFSGFIVFFTTLIILSKFSIESNNSFYGIRIKPVLSEQLNKADLKIIDNGYYTNLISTNNYCSQVWTNENDISRNWTRYITSKTTRPSYNLMLTENIPNASVKHNGIIYTLNSDGLRDKTYPKIKPDSCYRIIVLGGSYECGNGMSDGKDFISLVEDELNEKYTATRNDLPVQIELINFSSNGYRLLQRLYQYKDKARFWKPDALFLVIHSNYHLRIGNYVDRLVDEGYPISDNYLKNIIDKTGIDKYDDGPAVIGKLGTYADSINYYSVRSISEIARGDSTKVIAVFIPAIKDKGSKRDSVFMSNICNWYGLQPMSLRGMFSGMDRSTLALSDLDFHPNKKANELIAQRLLNEILVHQSYFNIKFIKK